MSDKKGEFDESNPIENVDKVLDHAPLVDEAAPNPLVSRILDGVVTFISIFAHATWIILVVAILANVIMRYVLGGSIVALEELQWHLYAFGFMVGLSYTLVHDKHVRVDVLADGWSKRRRARIEIGALLILVIPFAGLILYDSLAFVEFSMRLNEGSRSPGGLPSRWIIKSVIPLAMGLLILAALARLVRMVAFLRAVN
ncbi:TRAP transporter small permease subunit [Roseovarius sp. D22-M7]|uniref:TRAP transporter small permease subunit n=1 Tax=Roseovarius sp. D22-M7 TaxID=3127116 RepID=UPI00300F7DE5